MHPMTLCNFHKEMPTVLNFSTTTKKNNWTLCNYTTEMPTVLMFCKTTKKTIGLFAIYTRGLLGNADSSRFVQDHQEKTLGLVAIYTRGLLGNAESSILFAMPAAKKKTLDSLQFT